MSSILVVEDKFKDLEVSFQMMNTMYYDEEMVIDVKSKYQDIGNLAILDSYDVIIIDIDLGTRSSKDGFVLLNEIGKYNGELFLKVLVMTGSDLIRKKLDDFGYEKIPLLLKPISYQELYSAVSCFLE